MDDSVFSFKRLLGLAVSFLVADPAGDLPADPAEFPDPLDTTVAFSSLFPPPSAPFPNGKPGEVVDPNVDLRGMSEVFVEAPSFPPSVNAAVPGDNGEGGVLRGGRWPTAVRLRAGERMASFLVPATWQERGRGC